MVRTRAVQFSWLLFFTLLLLAGLAGYNKVSNHNAMAKEYQQKARESWLNNPDKHPHRMAHFGSFGFRRKHPLAVIDGGIENFTGNVVFLEAHKQNTVNFSEASFSTGLIRFGTLSVAFLVQVILPLLLLFFGFSLITSDKESGTLKLYFTQNVSRLELVLGNSIGLFIVGLLFATPAFVIGSILAFKVNTEEVPDLLIRFALLVAIYIVYVWTISVVTVLTSALSKTSKESLLWLLGIWLIWVVVLPKSVQSMGYRLHPTPSKIAFEAAIESDLAKEGDSHNPNDPHFKSIKDSLLRVYKIDSVQQLPFNYGGYIGFVGEKISSEIYVKHLNELFRTYEGQINYSFIAGFFDPFLSIKSSSMAVSATDFISYKQFTEQTESYRYAFTQRMNTLQMELIPNKKPDPKSPNYSISNKYWNTVKDFQYRYLSLKDQGIACWLPLLSVLFWVIFSMAALLILANKIKPL